MSDGSALTPEQVRRIADLARLALPDDALAPLAQELSGILHYVDILAELDLDEVPVFAHDTAATPLRDDVVRPGLSHDEALGGAPARDGTAFVVPKVVG